MTQQLKITDQPKSAKAQKISDTRKATRLRRESQICKTYEVKIDRSQLSRKALDHLILIFLEKKWIYNYLVTLPSNISLFEIDYKDLTEVTIKVGDHFESRSIEHLPAQIKQSIVDDIQNSIKSLATLKKRGHKVGALQPRPYVNSISLKQYLNTWYITATGKHVKIAGIKKHLRVLGLEQIPPNAELVSAKLILKYNNFFLKINCYLPKPKPKPFIQINLSKPNTHPDQPPKPKLDLKIDFGIKTPLTIGIDENNCIDVTYRIGPTKKLRKLARSASTDLPKTKNKDKDTKTKKKRKKAKKVKTRPPKKYLPKKKKRNKKKVKKTKRSHNYWKAQTKLRKEYAHIKNVKTNLINHLVNVLNKHGLTITFQKDNILAWKSSKRKGWGKKLHETNLGGFRQVLRERAWSPREVDTFFASTQTCYKCGHRQKMPLSERVYVCGNPNCNWVCGRDHNSTLTIGQEADRLDAIRLEVLRATLLASLEADNLPVPDRVPVERRELTSGETKTSTLDLLACLNNIPQVEASLVVEPQELLAGLIASRGAG